MAHKYLDIVDVILLVLDKNQNITLINKKGCELLGYAEDEIVGKNWFDNFVPEKNRNRLKDTFNRTLAGEIVLIEYHEDSIRTKSGEERLISWHDSIQTDEEGSIKEMLSSGEDITERRNYGNNLRKSEKLLLDITSSLAEGIYMIDAAGHINFMNPEAERLLGWTRQELTDKNVHDMIHFHKADGSRLAFEDCSIKQLIRTGERYFSQDEVFVRKDGTVFPISILASPVIEEEMIVGAVAAFQDISCRKKIEQDLFKSQKLESIGVLAGGIAHDFNNLLQTIMGNISLAKTNARPGDFIYTRLSAAESATLLAKELSNHLLTFSRGGEPLKKISSISGMLKETVPLFLHGTNIQCEFFLAEDLFPVNVDGNQMHQVIRSLMLNAREAMPEGGKIRVSVDNTRIFKDDDLPLKPGHYIRITMKDIGNGIPPENLPKIFDPYFTTKQRGTQKGMGLGLAICYSIIRKHEGFISVESQPGRGTTFYVYLPAITYRAC